MLSRAAVLRALTSVRSALVLLCVLATLLLLNVLLPQERVVGADAFAVLVSRSPSARLFLDTLGFGRMATHPLFVTALALFFVNLIAVLAARFGPTWRRARLKRRSEEGLHAWARLPDSLAGSLPEGWGVQRAVETLRDFGYQPRKVGESALWGVRHRTAPLGFLLFHASFLVLCAGGVSLYLTRFVGLVRLTEGQELSRYDSIARLPPLGRQDDLRFVVESVEARLERGQPVHLGVSLRLQTDAGWVRRSARVNHPVDWASASILVQDAGLAPVLWLQDPEGYTRDRVAVTAARGEKGTWVPLDEEALRVYLHPLPAEQGLPPREALAGTTLRLEVLRDGSTLFAGDLRPGEAVPLGDEGRLALQEIRYWAGLMVVDERGGGLLIVGFAMAVSGLVWRLLWFRREVAVTWSDGELRLVGHSEYHASRFREELEALFSALRNPVAARPSREGDTA